MSKKGMKKTSTKVGKFWKVLSKRTAKAVKKATKNVGLTGRHAKKAARQITKVAKKTAKAEWGFRSKAKGIFRKRRKLRKKAIKKAFKKAFKNLLGKRKNDLEEAGKKMHIIPRSNTWKKLWKVWSQV